MFRFLVLAPRLIRKWKYDINYKLLGNEIYKCKDIDENIECKQKFKMSELNDIDVDIDIDIECKYDAKEPTIKYPYPGNLDDGTESLNKKLKMYNVSTSHNRRGYTKNLVKHTNFAHINAIVYQQGKWYLTSEQNNMHQHLPEKEFDIDDFSPKFKYWMNLSRSHEVGDAKKKLYGKYIANENELKTISDEIEQADLLAIEDEETEEIFDEMFDDENDNYVLKDKKSKKRNVNKNKNKNNKPKKKSKPPGRTWFVPPQ